MQLRSIVSRFFVPAFVISLYYFLKYRCIVSLKAEVELSRNLIIGKKSRVSSFVKIKASNGVLRIGAQTDISAGCFMSASYNGLTIGDDCLIGANCAILSGDYVTDRVDKTIREQGHKSKGTRIGNNVLVGANSVILDGSVIGNGVIVAANSLVSGKIPDNSIVQGNPAKVIFVRR